MAENSFEFAGKKFKLGKINAMKQFHVARRVAPILADLVPIMTEVAKLDKTDDSLSQSEKLDQMAKLAAPLMVGVSRLSDKDSEMVLHALLQSVEIQQEAGNWARLSSGDALMFHDMGLDVMLNAAGRAFMYNMAGFFSALPRSS